MTDRDPIKLVHDRCEDVDDCWVWRQGVNNKGCPQMSWKGHGGQLVRRLVMEWDGRPAGPRYVVMAMCGDKLCCNPAHLFRATRSSVLRKSYEDGIRSRPVEYLKLRRQAERVGFAKLDMDKARDIRASSDETSVLARRYGVAEKTVRAIKTNLTWREAAANSSVFEMMPNCGG